MYLHYSTKIDAISICASMSLVINRRVHSLAIYKILVWYNVIYRIEVIKGRTQNRGVRRTSAIARFSKPKLVGSPWRMEAKERIFNVQSIIRKSNYT